MRRVRYGVGLSLDGYIAGPAGELGYLVSDPSYDQRAFFVSIDTVFMGQRTYDVAVKHGRHDFPGMRTYVLSRTLGPEEHPEGTMVAGDAGGVVDALRKEVRGKDIWLARGGTCLPACSPPASWTRSRWGSAQSCWGVPESRCLPRRCQSRFGSSSLAPAATRAGS